MGSSMTKIASRSANRRRTRQWVLAISLSLIAIFGAACRQDMHDQPKYRPLHESALFKDDRSARPLVDGTVARGFLRQDTEYYTGKLGDEQPVSTGQPTSQASGSTNGVAQSGTSVSQMAMSSAASNMPNYAGYTTTFPFPIDRAALDRGQERFNIYCSVCHGRLGEGDGMIVRRGYQQPPSYHEDRLRQAPVGYFFDVISNGFGAMPDYAAQISVDDRWKIVAYIRTLQLSHQGTTADVESGHQVGVPQQTEGEQAETQGEHK